MQIASIDIETSGLDCYSHDTMEVAVVLGDLFTDEEPVRQRFVILKDSYNLDPFCANMHQELIKEILEAKKFIETVLCEDLPQQIKQQDQDYSTYYCSEEDFFPLLAKWLEDQEVECRDDGTYKLNPAGKNFYAFDYRFLKALPDSDLVTFTHRALDPGPLYTQKGDLRVADLQTCLQRAGRESTVSHTAMEDAMDVFMLLRDYYKNINITFAQ